MPNTGSYNASEVNASLDREIERLRGQAHASWEKEARNLASFGLRDGMAVLEPGSGPGFVTEQLLTALPTATVTCIETDPQLTGRAEQYLRPKFGDRFSIVEASIMDTGLPSNTFDFAYARYLFQHLPDPLGAAGEILHLLKPGGKLAIADVDDGLFPIIDPYPQDARDIWSKLATWQAARGGDRFVGRRLWRILKAAGFAGLRLEMIAFHSDELDSFSFLPPLIPECLQRFASNGVLTEAEYQTLRAGLDTFTSAPTEERYVLLTLLMACGEKPKPGSWSE